MASIRRTLSPSDRSWHQKPSPVPPPSLVLVLGRLLCFPRSSHKPSQPPWKRSALRSSLFFLLGFLLGGADVNHRLHQRDLAFEVGSTAGRRDPGAGVRQGSRVVDTVGAEEIRPVVLEARERTGDGVGEGEVDGRKLLIVVTPTENRALQGYYLERLGQTLRLVRPPLVWIVVELRSASTETAGVLRRSGVMYRHIVCHVNSTSAGSGVDGGVQQRNAALEHVERHRMDGIVYFADDDNVYSLELFEQMRKIRRFGAWPVVMLAESKSKTAIEGPVCNGSQIIGWHTTEETRGFQRFHADMSGFAFNSTMLWDPKRWHRVTTNAIRQLDAVRNGFQVSTFIEQVLEVMGRRFSFPDRYSFEEITSRTVEKDIEDGVVADLLVSIILKIKNRKLLWGVQTFILPLGAITGLIAIVEIRLHLFLYNLHVCEKFS